MPKVWLPSGSLFGLRQYQIQGELQELGTLRWTCGDVEGVAGVAVRQICHKGAEERATSEIC